jgi:hypothetical protein
MPTMHALIFATLLEGTTRMSAAAGVWLFLVVIEWLAIGSRVGCVMAGLPICPRSVCRRRFTKSRPSGIEGY